MTKPAVRIALWAAAAVAVTGAASIAVVSSVGASPTVLTAADVARQLAADGTESPDDATPNASSVDGASPPSSSTDVPAGYFTSPGGTVIATCAATGMQDGVAVPAAGAAVLESWSPKAGYRADHVVRGPAATVSVEFESETAEDVTVEVSCSDGKPLGHIGVAGDDHGDDHGGGGSSGDGSGGGGSGSGGSGSGGSGKSGSDGSSSHS